MSGASIDAAFASLAGLGAGRTQAPHASLADAGAWSKAIATAAQSQGAATATPASSSSSSSPLAAGRSFELACFTPAAMGSNAAFARAAFASAMPRHAPAAAFAPERGMAQPAAMPGGECLATHLADHGPVNAGATPRVPGRGEAGRAPVPSRPSAGATPATPATAAPLLQEAQSSAAMPVHDDVARAAAAGDLAGASVVDLPCPDGPPWRVHVQWRGVIADAWIGLDARAAPRAREVVAALHGWIRDQGGLPGRIVLNGQALAGDAGPHSPFNPLGEP